MLYVRWLLRLIVVIGCAAFLESGPERVDARWQENQAITLGSSELKLTIDEHTGEWISLLDEAIAGNLLRPNKANPALDVSVAGEYLIAKYGATVVHKTVSVDSSSHCSTLSVTMGILPQTAGFAYELTSVYRLYWQQKRIERWARLVRNKLGPREHFDGFRFQLPGIALGQPDANRITVPGPFFRESFVRPNTPYDSLKSRTIVFHSAPDAGFGLVLMTNKLHKETLGSWMSTSGEVAYGTELVGNGQVITCRHDDKRAYYLQPQMVVESDTQHIEIARSVDTILTSYRKMVALTMPLDTETPEWVKKQIILEVYPTYYKGGFSELTARLPFYQSIGFTMLYLMPHWQGGYSPLNLYAVDSRFGTPNDLKMLIKTAHALGMKVIFDMVIHGFNEKSVVPQQHPDLFVRNEQGQLARHPTWKSITTDWASPSYQQYMIDLVRHDQREYDIDGYRVDAATFKGAGWNPSIAYPAYRDGSAAPELMRKMLAALRKKNPDAILLSEVFGPVFYSVCNFAHDNQTEAISSLLEKMQQGLYTAANYKQHVQEVYALLPTGANRVFYARNHDTSWFYHFDGYTDRFMAFEAVHSLFGIPEVFAGDPDHPANPDDDARIYQRYERLFAVRRSFPEFATGDVQLGNVSCTNQYLFSGVRSKEGRAVLGLVSFSHQVQKAVITFSPAVKNQPQKPIRLTDVQSGQSVYLTPAGAHTFRITLQPFQTVVGRIN